MKNTLLRLLAICLIATSFQSCLKDKCSREVTYIKYTPVYKTVDEIRLGIEFEDSKTLKNPGKIYYYNNHIFINEIREGIHIIDNNDPSNPVNIGFITIPGNVDIAIRNNILYADNYIDLLSIDIADMTNPQILDRAESVFPFEGQPDNETFLVYYEAEEVTETVDCNTNSWGRGWNDDVAFPAGGFLDNSNGSSDGGVQSSQPDVGIAGSMARFSLIGDFLYVIDESDMYVYDIAHPTIYKVPLLSI